MPSILEELYDSELDGNPFLFKSVSTQGGRKTATHEFVNSNHREVEDLGLFQGIFTIEAEISNAGGNYFAKKNALINSLNKRGTLVLKIPTVGILNVVAKPYTVIEKITDLGAAFFTLTFERAEDKIELLPELFTLSNIEVARTDTMNALAAEFAAAAQFKAFNKALNAFKVSQAFPVNFAAATSILDEIGEVFEFVTTTFTRVLEEIDDFAATLNDFRNNIRRFINLPGQLASSLTGLFDAAVLIYETPGEAVLSLESQLFSFGDLFSEIIGTTQERRERKINRDLLKNYIQVGALAYAYELAANIDFFTIREIDSFAEKLNTQFSKVFPLIRDNTAASELQNLRNITNEFLDIQRLNVKKIVEITTQPTTAQALMYQYYGDVDNYEKFTELNSIKNVSFISKTMEIFR